MTLTVQESFLKEFANTDNPISIFPEKIIDPKNGIFNIIAGAAGDNFERELLPDDFKQKKPKKKKTVQKKKRAKKEAKKKSTVKQRLYKKTGKSNHFKKLEKNIFSK